MLNIDNLSDDKKIAQVELCRICLFTKRQTIDLLGKDHKDLISKIFQDRVAEIAAAKESCNYPYAHQIWCLANNKGIDLLGKNIFIDFLWQHLNMDVIEQFATGVAFAMHHVQCVRVSDQDMPYVRLCEELWGSEFLSRDTKKFKENPGRELIREYFAHCKKHRDIPTMPKNENELKNSLAAYGAMVYDPHRKSFFHWSEEARALADEMISNLPDRRQRLLRLRFGLSGESAHTLKELSVAIDDSFTRTTASLHKSIRILRHPSRSGQLREYVFSGGKELLKNMPDNNEIDSMKSLLDRTVDSLDFPKEYSVRILNALQSENIFYIGDLIQKTEEEFKNIPNFGKKSLIALLDTLLFEGLSLGFRISVGEWRSPVTVCK